MDGAAVGAPGGDKAGQVRHRVAVNRYLLALTAYLMQRPSQENSQSVPHPQLVGIQEPAWQALLNGPQSLLRRKPLNLVEQVQ